MKGRRYVKTKKELIQIVGEKKGKLQETDISEGDAWGKTKTNKALMSKHPRSRSVDVIGDGCVKQYSR